MTNRRPFHETIVDIIDSLTSPATERQIIELVANLIKQTKIPKNHDVIIVAWRKLLQRTCRIDSSGMERDLLAQKQEAETETVEKTKEHDHSRVIHGRSPRTDKYPDGCLVNP